MDINLKITKIIFIIVFATGQLFSGNDCYSRRQHSALKEKKASINTALIELENTIPDRSVSLECPSPIPNVERYTHKYQKAIVRSLCNSLVLLRGSLESLYCKISK